MDEFKVGSRVKYELTKDNSGCRWNYGTIVKITSYENESDEFKYEIKLDNGKHVTLEYGEFDLIVANGEFDKEADILFNDLSKSFNIESMVSNGEELEKFKDIIRENLSKLRDVNEYKPMMIRPNGSENVSIVDKVKIIGDNSDFNVYYFCDNSKKYYHELEVKEIYTPQRVLNLINQIGRVGEDRVPYKFEYEIDLKIKDR